MENSDEASFNAQSQPSINAQMHSLYVSKLDAGLALLMSSNHHIFEFPALLLPEGISSGTCVSMQVHRDFEAEKLRLNNFLKLQDDILNEFGYIPEQPTLEIATLTSNTIVCNVIGNSKEKAREWAQVRIKKWELLKDGQRVTHGGAMLRQARSLELIADEIEQKDEVPKLKLTGLEPSHDYTLQLLLHTSAGVIHSKILEFQSRNINDLACLNVALKRYGNCENAVIEMLSKIKAKWTLGKINMESTHLISCLDESDQRDGDEIIDHDEKLHDIAADFNIPAVSYKWLEECIEKNQIVSMKNYYIKKKSIK